MTQVGVESIGWYRHEGTVEGDGIGREVEERAARDGRGEPRRASRCPWASDGERFKYVADVLVEEAGVTPMLHRLCRRPDHRGRRRPRRHHREQVRPGGDPREARRRCHGRRGRGGPRRGARPHDAARGDAGGLGDVLDDRREQGPLPRRREGRSRRPTGTGRATQSGTSRPRARRTSSSRRSCASRSSRRSRPGSSRPTSSRSPARGARSASRAT